MGRCGGREGAAVEDVLAALLSDQCVETASALHATMLVVLVGLVLAWWLLRRARWTTAAWAARRLRCTREGLQVLGVRAAAAWAARRLRCTREGLQVLGVRAAATAPLGAVGGALHPHAGGGGMDQHTLEILGSLELDRLGLRRPPRS